MLGFVIKTTESEQKCSKLDDSKNSNNVEEWGGNFFKLMEIDFLRLQLGLQGP